MRYHDITKNDMLNGDGLRVVLWVSGCSHHCPDCHNPLTWDPDDGLLFDEAAKQELFDELDRPHTAGLTLSGGDPLYPGNREDVCRLVREVKERYLDKTVWLYTGYQWNEISDLPVIPYVDVLVDGKFDRNQADRKLLWKGSRNQNVIDVPATKKLANPRGIVLHSRDYDI